MGNASAGITWTISKRRRAIGMTRSSVGVGSFLLDICPVALIFFTKKKIVARRVKILITLATKLDVRARLNSC